MPVFPALLLVVCLLPGLLNAQRVQRTVVLHNGYEANRLVRNHTVVHYFHNGRERVEGIVTVDRVLEYALNKEQTEFSNWVVTDTLCSFSGTIHRGRKTGTFVSFPPGNIFFLHSYDDNEKSGLFKGFYTFGQLFCEGTMLEGQKTGPYREYYANGQLARAQNFLDANNHVLHQEEYYITGVMQHRGYVYGGNKVNEWQYFDSNGNLSKTEYYTKYGRLKRVKNK